MGHRKAGSDGEQGRIVIMGSGNFNASVERRGGGGGIKEVRTM